MMLAGIFVDKIPLNDVVCGRSPSHERIQVWRLSRRIAQHQIVNVVFADRIARTKEPDAIGGASVDAARMADVVGGNQVAVAINV